ncbi:MAG: MipA/OmpV family protein, partial [Vogesella sp.]|uniref:MipA/OmpV family protein n=1 Tax=Vogesella sp. TaxID=1904252 RepID=UPI003F302DB3
SEAARSGLPAYQADSATRSQLGASWHHVCNRHLAVMTRVSVSHLPASLKWDAAARTGSPLVERNVTVTGMLGIHYRF